MVPHFFTVRDRAIIFRMCVLLNKTLLLSLILNTWPLTSNFNMSITDDNNESKINPSCSMPPALIKATYNDYFSISLLTICLIHFQKKFNTGRHMLLFFSLVTFLSYTLNAIWKCPRWRHMNSLEFCLYCDVYVTENKRNQGFHVISKIYGWCVIPIWLRDYIYFQELVKYFM